MGIRQDLVFRVARRWIAGDDMQSGLDAAKEANRRGFIGLLNLLGEDVTDAAAAESQTNEYFALQNAMSGAGINGSVSVKVTQLGLLFDEQLVAERLSQLASRAGSMGQLLWLDMEGSSFTDKTLELYTNLIRSHRNAGVALQAYMRRSEKDLRDLLEHGARVRLVKGAYREKRDVVYGSRKEVTDSFSRLMRSLFESGDNFTIATHDSNLVSEARKLAETHHKSFEFGMLRGIRDDLKAELVASGYKVVDYIPYGSQWYSYSMRRIKEHPSNIRLLLRSLL